MARAGVVKDEHHILLLRFREDEAADSVVDEVSEGSLTVGNSPGVAAGFFNAGRAFNLDGRTPLGSHNPGTCQYAVGAADPTTATALLGEWTVEIQCKMAALRAGENPLLIFQSIGEAVDTDDSYLCAIYVRDTGYLESYWEEAPGGPGYTALQDSGAKVVAGQDARIGVVKRSTGGGLYAVDLYLNGVLVDTVTGLSNAIGGALGQWAVADDDHDLVSSVTMSEIAVSSVARTAAYLYANHLRAVGASSSNAPTVSELTPDDGAALGATGPITFTVADADGSEYLSRVVVGIKYADRWELVYDGASFAPNFSDLSSVEDIGEGQGYVIRRTRGWPASPTLWLVATDTAGSENE